MPYFIRYVKRLFLATLIATAIMLMGSNPALAKGETFEWGNEARTILNSKGGDVKLKNPITVDTEPDQDYGYRKFEATTVDGSCGYFGHVDAENENEIVFDIKSCNGSHELSSSYSVTPYSQVKEENVYNQAKEDASYKAWYEGLKGKLSPLKSGYCVKTAGDSTNKYTQCMEGNDDAFARTLYNCSVQAGTKALADKNNPDYPSEESRFRLHFNECLATTTGVSPDTVNEATKDISFEEFTNASKAATDAKKTVAAEKCVEDGGTVLDDGTCDYSTAEEVESTCQVTMGWLICPIMELLGEALDSGFNFLSGHFLKTNPQLLTEGDTVKIAWGTMRSIANVVFVIAFLVIIYSQLTSTGLTNYGLKKLLPKLIISAVLVNLSFVICQIAVDLSNILGYSLKEVFDGSLAITPETAIKEGLSITTNNSGLSGGAIVVAILAGAAGIVTIALTASIPVILMGVLALMMIALILFARTALIIILTIVSPLAFVAFLLPNTEQWFKKWFKLFSSLLMLFPIIAVVFGASGLAAKVLLDVAANGGGIMMTIAALAAATLPLFTVPGLLKGALNATGAMGAKLSSLSSGANARARRAGSAKAKERYGNSAFARGRAQRKQSKQQFKDKRFADAVAGEDTSRMGRFRRFSSGVGSPTFTKSGEYAKDNMVLAAGAAVRKDTLANIQEAESAFSDELTAAQASGGASFNMDEYLAKQAKAAHSSGNKTRERAIINKTAQLGRSNVLRKLREGGDADTRANVQEAINSNASSLASKAPDLVKGEAGAFADFTGADMAGWSADTADSYMDHLERLYNTASAPGATADDIQAMQKASSKFNAALRDIQENDTIQLKGSTGQAITKRLTPSNGMNATKFQQDMATTAAKNIGPDGRIR